MTRDEKVFLLGWWAATEVMVNRTANALNTAAVPEQAKTHIAQIVNALRDSMDEKAAQMLHGGHIPVAIKEEVTEMNSTPREVN